MERFNKTLKAMLRKTVISKGKDCNKLIPYVLFAYREVPHASTGFSPFKLLYRRLVRGLLDLIRVTWEGSTATTESVLSYVLAMKEKLTQMTELVPKNLSNAQAAQKTWYDKTARVWSFEPGDRVLVLLPTSTNSTMAGAIYTTLS